MLFGSQTGTVPGDLETMHISQTSLLPLSYHTDGDRSRVKGGRHIYPYRLIGFPYDMKPAPGDCSNRQENRSHVPRVLQSD